MGHGPRALHERPRSRFLVIRRGWLSTGRDSSAGPGPNVAVRVRHGREAQAPAAKRRDGRAGR